MEITRWNAAGKGPRSYRLTSRLIVYKTYQQTPSLFPRLSFTLAFSNRHSRCDRYRDPRLRRGGKGRNLLLLFFSLFLFPNHPGTTRCKLENIKCKVALDYAPHPSKHAFSTRVPSTIPVVFSLGAPPPPICPREIIRAIFANSLWTFILSSLIPLFASVRRGKKKKEKITERGIGGIGGEGAKEHLYRHDSEGRKEEGRRLAFDCNERRQRRAVARSLSVEKI